MTLVALAVVSLIAILVADYSKKMPNNGFSEGRTGPLPHFVLIVNIISPITSGDINQGD